MRLSGNKVSEDGGNRSRRVWKPNVITKAVYSEALDRMVRLNMTTAALRHIDKVGGLDNYILNVPKQKQQSDLAQQLRQRIEAALQKPLRDALKANSEATSSGLFDWPQPEPESASAASNGSGSSDEQQSSRKHRQKRISATEEVLVKEEETDREVRRWTRRTRWDGSLTPIKKRVYPKAEWARVR
ncbi:g3978 [Coccomyxa viridis]|uniref:G3978 protein n=1 Tax=Coccomyxa viridis TaxID=1274662 RepID=A0ABP1FRF6_9CHLO